MVGGRRGKKIIVLFTDLQNSQVLSTNFTNLSVLVSVCVCVCAAWITFLPCVCIVYACVLYVSDVCVLRYCVLVL